MRRDFGQKPPFISKESFLRFAILVAGVFVGSNFSVSCPPPPPPPRCPECAAVASTTSSDNVCGHVEFVDLSSESIATGRVDGSMQSKYTQMKKETIGGWLDFEDLYSVKLLSDAQHAAGVVGSVGEIGVHHGLLFVGLAQAAYYSEPVFAADIFEQQQFNFDNSGRGDKAIFLKNIDTFTGRTSNDVTLFEGSSLDLTAARIAAKGLPRARMFSVDGCHTFDCTLSDIKVAACTLAPGGIVLIDDYAQAVDPEHKKFVKGVSTAVTAFLGLEGYDLVPFLATANKLYMSDSAHVAQYRKVLEDDLAFENCLDGTLDIHGHVTTRLSQEKRGHFNFDFPGAPCLVRADLQRIMAMDA